MKIYIDDNFKCYAANDGTMREIETDFFDGKCKSFIEGYRFVPSEESWTREDGKVFEGEMICPLRDYNILVAYQEQYEADLAEKEDMQTALETLGVNVNG